MTLALWCPIRASRQGNPPSLTQKDTNPLCNPCMSLNYNFIWLLCYLLVLVGLAGYGFHRLSIVYLYWKNRNNKPQPKARFQELPVVTVQLPMFNEKFVVDRLLESVAALDYPQDKLVRVVNGEVFDVAVDLREGSETYGKWFGVVLSAENKKQFFIPKGFAHGFLVLSDHAEFVYKCSDFYHPNDEGGLIWNDPDIGVEWPIPEGMELSFSDKDTKWGSFKDYRK